MFSLTAYSGETSKFLDFKTDPYYYHSNPNNNFSFFCEYNAPVGEVNFVFPDAPCASFAIFESYTGERTEIDELFIADWLPFSYTGEELTAELFTILLIPITNGFTGEIGAINLTLPLLLIPTGVSGENIDLIFTISSRAELVSDGYSGEFSESDLSVSYSFDFYTYSGEWSESSLTLTDYGTYILTEGPAAYWKFNEQSGSQVIDSTGNNSAATINGTDLGIASPVASKYSFYFSGTDTVVGPPTSIISPNLTQELWVKPDAGATITLFTPTATGTAGTVGQRYAVFPYNNAAGSGGGISVGSNGIQVVAHGSSYLPILLSYQQPISTTEYTHILVSWLDRTPTLYVNGSAVATGYQARAPFASQGLPNGSQYGYYKGHMQDVAIYSSALTAEQAREHYLAGLGLHYIPRFEPLPVYTGELLESDLTIDLTPVGYIFNFTGEYTQAFLENNVRFYPEMSSGENSFVNELILVPFILFGITNAINGENVLFDNFSTETALDPVAFSGEIYSQSLSIFPSINLGIFPNLSGEDITLDLLTSSVLEIITYAGEVSNFGLSVFQSEGMGLLPFYSGERNYFEFSTKPLLPNIGFTGERFAFDLLQSSSFELTFPHYTGQYSQLNLQTSFQLSVNQFSCGAYGIINEIGTESNIYFYADSGSFIELSTTDIFKINSSETGEVCYTELQIKPSGPLGLLNFYSDETTTLIYNTYHHSDFYVVFRTSVMTQVDMDSATYFDLSTDQCCGIRKESLSNNLIIYLSTKDHLHESVSFGDRVIFSIDLNCQPRFEVEYQTGATFDFSKEYNGFLEVDFYTGNLSLFNGFEADLTNKLCKGYFIPNGNWLVVELNDILPENCYADVFYSGTSLSCILSDDVVFRVEENHWGESLIPSLTTFPPWIFIIRAGEILYFNLALEQAMLPAASNGERLFFALYEEPFICFTGESADFSLTIEYYVRFKESGCFDNDFVYQNESGDLIEELSNTVPVEGEPFYHSVLAECG